MRWSRGAESAIKLADSITAEIAVSTAADGNDDDDDDSGGGGGGSGGLDDFIVSDDDEESDDDDDDDDDDDGDDDEEIDLSEALRKACDKAKSRLAKLKRLEAFTVEREARAAERDAAGVDKFMPERPEHHFCPLTLKVMDDPVMDALGTYERAAIEKWLFVATEDDNGRPRPNKQRRSRMRSCRTRISPNYLVSTMIQEWEEHHKKCMARRLRPGRP